MPDPKEPGAGKRGPTLFDPSSSMPFQLSRYRIDRFLECSRCFWLDLRKGLKPPQPHPYTLNIAVDILVKKEFDLYRRINFTHPLMRKFGIKGVPFNHPKLSEWRMTTPGKGMRFLYPGTNLDIMGALDDIWFITEPEPSLAIVDVKSTSSRTIRPIEDGWWKSYRRQLEIYIWLLDRQKTGHTVSRTGYFLLMNCSLEREKFDLALTFDPYIIPYHADDSWVSGAILDAYACLMNPSSPPPSPNCEYCAYRCKAAKLKTPTEQ